MNRNRGFARATAAVVAVLVLVPAPTAAQESGALIGLRQWTDSGGAYRTVWIAREGGAVRLLASGPDLIVPRRSRPGLCRQACTGRIRSQSTPS